MRGLSLTAVLSVSVLLPLAVPQEDDNLYWLDNYETAVKEAKATGRPIFLEYRCEP
jgi:hypothetical protein